MSKVKKILEAFYDEALHPKVTFSTYREIQIHGQVQIDQAEAELKKLLPEKVDRCKCYDNGNRPALLTDFHSGTNKCASCGKIMSSDLKIYNQVIDEMTENMFGEEKR